MKTATVTETEILSLENWMLNPPKGEEWVDGKLVEKSGMTLAHSEIQANLAFYWKNYSISSRQGGKVYTEAPCRIEKQGREPDVAYLTPELVAEYGKLAVLPQSFPLIAEIASPADFVEDLFAKATEYLQSGCVEVWLLLPKNRYIFVITKDRRLWFAAGEVAGTQTVLQGFSVSVDELLA